MGYRDPSSGELPDAVYVHVDAAGAHVSAVSEALELDVPPHEIAHAERLERVVHELEHQQLPEQLECPDAL